MTFTVKSFNRNHVNIPFAFRDKLIVNLPNTQQKQILIFVSVVPRGLYILWASIKKTLLPIVTLENRMMLHSFTLERSITLNRVMIYTQLIFGIRIPLALLVHHIHHYTDTRYQILYITDIIYTIHHRYNIYYLSNTHVFITPMPIATRTIKYYSAVRSTIPLSQCLFTVDKLMLNFLAVCD